MVKSIIIQVKPNSGIVGDGLGLGLVAALVVWSDLNVGVGWVVDSAVGDGVGVESD